MARMTALELRGRQADADHIERLLRIADDYEGRYETELADLYRQLASALQDRNHWKALAEGYQRELLSFNFDAARAAMARTIIIDPSKSL